MKRSLLLLLAALALPTAVNADYGNDEIMIHRFCTSRARKGIESYRDCLKENDPQKYMKFTYKGKTYKPSRNCPFNEEMRWRNVGLFGGRLEELGCMTEKEHEAYWREYKMRRETRPIMIQRTNVNTNTTIEFR